MLLSKKEKPKKDYILGNLPWQSFETSIKWPLSHRRKTLFFFVDASDKKWESINIYSALFVMVFEMYSLHISRDHAIHMRLMSG